MKCLSTLSNCFKRLWENNMWHLQKNSRCKRQGEESVEIKMPSSSALKSRCTSNACRTLLEFYSTQHKWFPRNTEKLDGPVGFVCRTATFRCDGKTWKTNCDCKDQRGHHGYLNKPCCCVIQSTAYDNFTTHPVLRGRVKLFTLLYNKITKQNEKIYGYPILVKTAQVTAVFSFVFVESGTVKLSFKSRKRI